MTTFASLLRQLTQAFLFPFDLLSPLLGLTAFSIISGVFMLWVLKKTSFQSALQIARDRMAASVYEVRLFIDSPRLMLGAQWRLLLWSFRYVGYMLPTFLVLTPPLALLYPQLEIRYGLAALSSEIPVLVHIKLAPEVNGETLVIPENQEGIEVTAPPLLFAKENLVYVRIKTQEPGTHSLKIQLSENIVEKEISADPDKYIVSPERNTGWIDAFSFGDEDALFPADKMESIWISHEGKNFSIFGLSVPWWLYWLLVSIVVALALRKPMGVVF